MFSLLFPLWQSWYRFVKFSLFLKNQVLDSVVNYNYLQCYPFSSTWHNFILFMDEGYVAYMTCLPIPVTQYVVQLCNLAVGNSAAQVKWMLNQVCDVLIWSHSGAHKSHGRSTNSFLRGLHVDSHGGRIIYIPILGHRSCLWSTSSPVLFLF